MSKDYYGAAKNQERRTHTTTLVSVVNDESFQAFGSSIAISKAPHAYTLQWSVTGDFDTDCNDVNTCPAGEKNSGAIVPGCFYRCHGLSAGDKVHVRFY